MSSQGQGKGHVGAKFAFLFGIGLIAAATPRTAFGQSDSDDVARAGARSAATAGAEAMDQQRWADAVDLFSRAESLVHAPPHLLYIARASVKLGQLVRAQENYLRILREHLGPDAPQPFLDAQAAAGPELDQLRSRIPVVTIRIVGKDSGAASVVVDGEPVAPALIGMAHPMDPGKHTFQASTPSLTSDPIEVTIGEGARQDVELTLSHAVPGASPEGAAGAGPAPGAAADTAPASASGGAWMRPAAIAAAAVGVVGVGVGTVFLLKNRSARGDADALCPGGNCPESQRAAIESKDSDADSAATMSWIGYGVGVAGLAAGVALWLLAPPSSHASDRPAAARAGLVVAPTLGGATLLGRFQ